MSGWDHTLTLKPADTPDWLICSGPLCREPAVYMATYLYVTGKSGRVTDAERYYCAEHGQKFAAKHGLETPDERTEVRA